jgi:hypothetical protein
MGSIVNNTPVKAHKNSFNAFGQVIDNTVTGLNTPHGAFQEAHNASDQAAATAPRYPNTNQDLHGAEAAGASQLT